MKILDFAVYSAPIGNIRVAMDEGALVLLDFEENLERSHNLLKKRYGNFSLREVSCWKQVQEPLDAYFAGGELNAFDQVGADPAGTSFQQAVWDALKRIPAGQLRTYSELAREIGKPHAIRAVGSANANNPIAIIIPCHRVIAKDGGLSGYAGGTNRKQWLLRHEGAVT